MSERIEVGDLVMIVNGCCGFDLGKIGTVTRIRRSSDFFFCRLCRQNGHVPGGVEWAHVDGIGRSGYQKISWLKKIEPPAVVGTITTHEEQPA